MTCNKCKHRRGKHCQKYNTRLELNDVYGIYVLFYRLEECE